MIAATNRDLNEMCEQGLFRSDLYYRLNILNVEIPPLRERREDIIPLARFFLNNFNKKYGFSKVLSYRLIQHLKKYQWHGNVRELRNVIERLVMTSQTDILDLEYMSGVSTTSLPSPVQPPAKPLLTASESVDSLQEAISKYEKSIIMDTLDSCNGNVAKAAEKLKIHKTSLYRKLEKYRS